jgi:pimeloyl-ACP methyl ester carboxylesterase
MALLLDGRLELDTTLFELRTEGTAVPLEPQAFDVLVHLVTHRDRVVPKEELMDVVWGGRFVTEAAVTSRIKQVRRALGDDGQRQSVVRTVHGRGYRFVAEVRETPTAATPGVDGRPVAAPPERPSVRYTVSDGLHVAYQVTGGGERDIVLISGFVSHLDLDWEDPRHAYFLDSLGGMGRLIRFDKRGTGMSDRPSDVPDLETRMHDVLAVMDAVGSARAVVCGYSEGGPMACLLAAMHPERVSSLVIYASYARRIRTDDYPWAPTREARAAYTERLVNGWDWEEDMRMRNPSADEAMQRWWRRRMGAAATPSTIRALNGMNDLVDVREVLPTIRVPTLVVHRRDDPLVRVDEATYIARRIPEAELVILEGRDHFVSGDPEQLIEAIEPFVRAQPVPVQERSLAVVVAAAGPRGPEAVASMTRVGGQPRRAAGGGDVVVFEGPATAVRAAEAAVPTDGGLGLAIAEVAQGPGPAVGPGVDLARELARRAAPGQVLVSTAVGMLLPGSGIPLSPTGDDAVLSLGR